MTALNVQSVGCELSIVIVNWNTRDLLLRCLRSVQDDVETCKPANVQTFVVDNASADSSGTMVKKRFPWAQLIENSENVGFARANNQALALCQGRYALLLNSDTAVHPGALRTLVQFMDAHPRAGAAGARLLNADGTLQISCLPMPTPGREFWRLMFLDRLWSLATYPMKRWDMDTPRRVETIKGACLLLRREALDRVGLLDERFFMYTEEVDLCYRLAQAGWELWYVPQAVVTHDGEASTRQVAASMYLQLYRSKVQFFRKVGGIWPVLRYRLLLAIAYAPRWLAIQLAALFSPRYRPRAAIYRQLLSALPGL